MAGHEIAWTRGGRTMTLEEYLRQERVEIPPPARGTRSRDEPVATVAWRDRARCKAEGVGVDFFFPAEGDQASLPRIVRFCEPCPVAVECADYARTAGIAWGWWGGLSPRQRNGLTDTSADALVERSHGTYQRYKYGPFGRASGAGCRCTPCRDAASAEWRKSQEADRRRRRKQRAQEGR